MPLAHYCDIGRDVHRVQHRGDFTLIRRGVMINGCISIVHYTDTGLIRAITTPIRYIYIHKHIKCWLNVKQ